jgi:hypothetical protein
MMQDYLMLHRRDPEQAVRHLNEIGPFQFASVPAQKLQGPRTACRANREEAAGSNGRVQCDDLGGRANTAAGSNGIQPRRKSRNDLSRYLTKAFGAGSSASPACAD